MGRCIFLTVAQIDAQVQLTVFMSDMITRHNYYNMTIEYLFCSEGLFDMSLLKEPCKDIRFLIRFLIRLAKCVLGLFESLIEKCNYKENLSQAIFKIPKNKMNTIFVNFVLVSL